jgi:sulfatase modifying factor 1
MFRIVFYGLIFALFTGLLACGQKAEEPSATQEVATPTAPKDAPGDMVLIPAGTFVFGTDDDTVDKDWFAHPKQNVDLPAFWVDKFEVTNMQFLDFTAGTGYRTEGAKEGRDWRTFFTAETAKHPVVYVTYNDAVAYCKGQGKRLPTEYEWEKAARGTEGWRYPWGDTWEKNRSNTYEIGNGSKVNVGRYERDISPFGARDMLGNVREWTDSWFKAYKGNSRRHENYGETYRVVRGLSYQFYGGRSAVYTRGGYLPGSLFDFGFRCAKDATPEEAAKAPPSK